MTNPYRAMCSELIEAIDSETADWEDIEELKARARALLAQPVAKGPTDEELLEMWHSCDWFDEGATLREFISIARAVLARWGRPTPQPVAEGPTDEEIGEVYWKGAGLVRAGTGEHILRGCRAVLARWGHPAPQPVAVSERLPGPEDCDEQGRCWLLTVEDEYPQWRLHSIEGAQPGGAMIWVPVDSSPGVMVDCFYTSHWLPANALPTPEATND